MMSDFLFVLFISFLFASGVTWGKSVNEEIRGSHRLSVGQRRSGSPVPMPQYFSTSEKQFNINARAFSFQYDPESQTCDLIRLAFKRYHNIIFNPLKYSINLNEKNVRKIRKSNLKKHPKDNDLVIDKLVVNVKKPCEKFPTLESDESCKFTP